MITEKLTTNQNAVDKYGVVFNIEEVNKDMVMYHLMTGERVFNVLNVTKQVKHFRLASEHKKSGGNPKESELHKYIKGVFSKGYISSLELDGFDSKLTGCEEEKRISICKTNNKNIKTEISHFIPDVYFNECIIEVVVSTKISIKKRMLFESLGIPIIIIDFSEEKRSRYEIYKHYDSLKISEVIDDIIGRCKLTPSLQDDLILPYVDKLKIYNGTYKDILSVRDSKNNEIDSLKESIEDSNMYNSRIKEEHAKLKETLENKESDYFAAQSIIDSLTQQNKELSKVNDNKPLLDKIESQKEVITNQVGKVADFHMFLMKKPELWKEWKQINKQANGIR
jgi:hypothetical protein